MKARHPVTKLWKYFVDKCLPFGSSISCSHFQHFSNALKHLVRVHTVSESINNYLDNFLFVAATLLICNFMIQQFMDLCAELNIPIAEDKTEWATLRLVFLGILLNGQNMTLVVPDQKRVVAINMLKTLVDRKKATIKKLQSLCGYLNFLNKAVVPGRTFTRRMYAKFSHVVDCTGWNNGRARIREISSNNKPRLKPHHQVCLDAEFKSDCSVWIQFLESKGLEGVVCRLMMDLSSKISSVEVGFYSDASRVYDLAMGCTLGNRWIFAKWPERFVEDCEPSIEYLELFAIVAGVFTWESRLANVRFIVHCDNQAVVHMVNKLMSSCKHCMKNHSKVYKYKKE